MRKQKRNKKLKKKPIRSNRKKRVNKKSNKDSFINNLKTKGFVENLERNGDIDGLREFQNQMKKELGFRDVDFLPFKSSEERITDKGDVRIYDCGDMIIRTDFPELKKILNEKLLGNGLKNFIHNDLQERYSVPLIIGGFWKKDNWNVYKDDMDKPYKERGRYEYENSQKTPEDMNFIRGHTNSLLQKI